MRRQQSDDQETGRERMRIEEREKAKEARAVETRQKRFFCLLLKRYKNENIKYLARG